MDIRQTLKLFLQRYGSDITSQGITSKGIIRPVYQKPEQFRQIIYPKTGFIPLQVYRIITLAETGLIEVDREILSEGKRFRVTECDMVYFQNGPLYQNAYAYEIKEIVS